MFLCQVVRRMWLEKDALRAVDIVGRRLQWHLDVTEQMIVRSIALRVGLRCVQGGMG